MSTSATDPAAAKPKRLRKRRPNKGRWAIWAVLVIVGVPLVLVAGLLVFLSTNAGRDWTVRTALDAINEPGALEISIEDVDGTWPFQGRLTGVSVRDGDGVWLEFPEARWHLDAWALLGGTLHVRDLSVQDPRLIRVPKGSEEEKPPEPFSLPQIPNLPVSLKVDRILIEGAELPPELTGEAVRLRAQVSGAWNGTDLDLDAELLQTDREGLNLAASIESDPASRGLTLSLEGGDRAGGALAALIGEPDLGAVRLSGSGDGTASAWSGRFDVDGAGFGTLQMTVSGGWGEGRALDTQAVLRPGSALSAEIRDITGPEALLRFQLAFPQARGTGTALALQDLTLQARDLTVEGALSLDPDGDAKGGAYIQGTVSAKLTSLLTAVGEDDAPIEFSSGDLALDIAGALGAPELTGRLSASDLRLDDITFTAIGLSLVVVEGPEGYRLALEGTGDGFHPGADTPWPYGRTLTLNAEGLYEPETGALRLSQMGLKADGVVLEGNGAWNLKTSSGAAQLTGTGQSLEAFAPGVLTRGRALITLSAEKSGQGAPLDVVIDAQSLDLQFEDERLGGLIGPSARLTGALRQVPGGALELSALGLKSQAGTFSLSGSGRLMPDTGALNAKAVLSAQKTQVFSALAGIPLAGPLKADIAIGGTLKAPRVSLNAQSLSLRVRDLELKDLILRVLYAPDGTADVLAEFKTPQLANYQDHRAEIEIIKGKSGALRLTKASGSLLGMSISPAEGPVGVELATKSLLPVGRAMRLALGPDSPAPSGGSLVLKVVGGDRPSINLNTERLTLSLGSGETAQIGSAVLNASLGDGNSLAGRLRVSEAIKGAYHFRTIEGDVSGTLDDPRFEIKATEALKDGIRLSLLGSAPQNGEAGRIVRIAKFDFALGDARVELTEPVTLDLSQQDGFAAAQSAEVRDVASGRKGTISLKARQSAHGISANIDLAGLPFGLLRTIRGMPLVAGLADGSVTLSTLPGETRGQLDLTVSDFGRTRRLRGGELVARGSWNGKQAALTLTLNGQTGAGLRASLALPLLRGAGGVPVIPDNARVQGTVTGEGRLENIFPYLPLAEHYATGDGNIDLAISGPLEAPRLEGLATVKNGTYESLDTGLSMRKVDLAVDFKGRAGRLTLTAADGNGGKLEGKGSLSLTDEGFTIDAALDLKKARLVRRDDVDVQATGGVKIAGTSAKGIDVTGAIRVNEANVKIPDELPPQIVDLQTERVSALDTIGEGLDAGAREREAIIPIRLNIDIEAEKAIKVEGRGLSSLWNADARIFGTAREPRIAGTVDLSRGELDFISRQFELSQGEIAFDGGRDIDPRLNIEARHESNNIIAIVRIQGTASNPGVTLSSEPALQQDAILAQLLFGKSVSELSTIEVVQMAQVLATLSGGGSGGFNLLGKARDALGIDVLKVNLDGTSSDPTENVSVTVGKYISEDVYVGVKQGATAGSTAVTLEVELTDNLKLHTDVAQTKGSSVGLTYELDY